MNDLRLFNANHGLEDPNAWVPLNLLGLNAWLMLTDIGSPGLRGFACRDRMNIPIQVGEDFRCDLKYQVLVHIRSCTDESSYNKTCIVFFVQRVLFGFVFSW